MSSRPDAATTAVAVATTTERLALCDLLDTLGPDDWATPSLCAGWTVQDVAAHLTLATLDTTWAMVKGVIRARGSFDRMTTDTARERARRHTPAELVRQIRDTAASTRRAPFASPVDALVDILVHGQDIARPVGRVHPVDPTHAVPALELATTSRWYGGPRRWDDVTLVAADADWSTDPTTGGAEATGPAGDLLLVATGRPAGLAALTGPGVALLAARLG